MADRPSESGLIARYFAPLAGPGSLGLRDDAACFAPPAGHEIVITKDILVAGVHFFADDAADAVARKALRVNLSDLAAKGAGPLGFLLGLALPSDWQAAWLEQFAHGLGDDAKAYACPLLGGDTVKTPGPAMVSITALGSVPVGRMVPRTGARAGDRIYVSGTIGDAALGLRLRQPGEIDRAWIGEVSEAGRSHLLDRYLLPRPRLALALAMRDHAHAGMDVSDGLVGDLAKVLAVSGVTAEVILADVPLSTAAAAAARASPECFDVAVTGGDDYEMLACVGADRCAAFEASATAAGVAVRAIGVVKDGAGVTPLFLDRTGRARTFASGSHDHFGS